MIALAGPLHLLATVLVVSGVQKLTDPTPAGTALVHARLPVPATSATVAGVAIGALEIGVGLAALAVPAWWAAAGIALVYAGFTGFILRLRRVDAGAGCGCFGATSAPPGPGHIAFDVAAATLALGTAFVGVPDIVDVFDVGLLTAATYVVALAIGAGIVLVVLAQSAALADAARTAPARAFQAVR